MKTIRKHIHEIASSWNSMIFMKDGKRQMTPGQRAAYLVEQATWTPPEVLNSPKGREAMIEMSRTFPALDPQRLISFQNRAAVRIFERVVENYWELGDNFKNIYQSVGSAIYDLQGVQRHRFLNHLKNPEISSPDVSFHDMISSVHAVALCEADLKLPTAKHWEFVRSCQHGYDVSIMDSDETFQRSVRHRDDFIAGAIIAETLWSNLVKSFSDASWVSSELGNAELESYKTELIDAIERGSILNARHTPDELIALGHQAHVFVDAMEAVVRGTRKRGFDTEVSDEAFEAGAKFLPQVAPASASWNGIEDWKFRIKAPKMLELVNFEQSKRMREKSIEERPSWDHDEPSF